MRFPNSCISFAFSFALFSQFQLSLFFLFRSFDYFGFKTLEKNYLTRMNGAVVERPQHLFMRVAVGMHQPVSR